MDVLIPLRKDVVIDYDVVDMAEDRLLLCAPRPLLHLGLVEFRCTGRNEFGNDAARQRTLFFIALNSHWLLERRRQCG
jgi:hypothetical protein